MPRPMIVVASPTKCAGMRASVVTAPAERVVVPSSPCSPPVVLPIVVRAAATNLGLRQRGPCHCRPCCAAVATPPAATAADPADLQRPWGGRGTAKGRRQRNALMTKMRTTTMIIACAVVPLLRGPLPLPLPLPPPLGPPLTGHHRGQLDGGGTHPAMMHLREDDRDDAADDDCDARGAIGWAAPAVPPPLPLVRCRPPRCQRGSLVPPFTPRAL